VKHLTTFLIVLAFMLMALFPAGYVLFPDGLQNIGFYALGRAAALTALALLALQFVLPVRSPLLDRLFGLQRLLFAHRCLGLAAVVLALSHPLFLVLSESYDVSLLTGTEWPVFIMAGKVLLLLLAVHVIYAVAHGIRRRHYRTWRLLHGLVAPVILIMAVSHGWSTGGHLTRPIMQVYIGVLVLLVLWSLVYKLLVSRGWLFSRNYVVENSRKENTDTTTLRFAPAAGTKPMSSMAGQYAFVAFPKAGKPGKESHPYTIASSPEDLPAISAKAIGHFSSALRDIAPGAPARIHGPFGRFCHVLYPRDKKLVFIAGGIGITPFISMLRHMRDSNDSREVLLLYSCRRVRDFLFTTELQAMADKQTPALRTVRVLSHEQAEGYVSGRIDGALIRRYCTDMSAFRFFICGPQGMIVAIARQLKHVGVPGRQIHYELFRL